MTTLLQISDPHLLSRPDGRLKGVPTAESLAQVLERARVEIPDPDCVVLTGDLSHEETEAGYIQLRTLLGDWNARSLLIPGNHDNRSALRRVFPHVPGTEDEPIWFCHRVGPWLLLGLDTHVPGEVHGAICEASLERLDALLAENASDPALIFLHHHPAAIGSMWLDRIGLQNAAALESLLVRHHNVYGLFCGHVHQVFEGAVAGVPFHSGPSTAIQFLPGTEAMQFDLQPPGFRVIELNDRQFSTRVVRLDRMPFTPHDDSPKRIPSSSADRRQTGRDRT